MKFQSSVVVVVEAAPFFIRDGGGGVKAPARQVGRHACAWTIAVQQQQRRRIFGSAQSQPAPCSSWTAERWSADPLRGCVCAREIVLVFFFPV